jgi:hypothetical protein
MQNINEFSKGLHRSNSPITQPEGSYFDALNWVRNDEGRLINEEQEELILSLEKDLKNTVTLNDEVICFFEDEIGILKDNTYTTIVQRDFLNISKDVKIKARLGYSNNRLIYFVEKDKYIRYVNLDADFTKEFLTEDSFNLQLTYKYPSIDNIAVNNTGSLKTGVYFIVARYLTSDGNGTYCGIPSNPIPIVDGIRNNNDDNYDGAPPQSPSNKSISFNVGNNDQNYPFIEILIITYEEITNVLTAYSIGKFNNNSNTITFASNEQFVNRVDLSEITSTPVFYSSASLIQQKDNVLVLSNLKSKKRNNDIQEIANNIRVRVLEEATPYDVNVEGLPAAIARGATIMDNVVDTGNNSNYSSKNELYVKDFQRGETYSFSVTPIYTNGEIDFAYPIPAYDIPIDDEGRHTGISENSEGIQYPSNYGSLANQNVRNHQMQDQDVFPLYKDGNLISLRLKFYNIDFSSIPDVAGYIIGYQKRDSPQNKYVLTEGITRLFCTGDLSPPNISDEGNILAYGDAFTDRVNFHTPSPLLGTTWLETSKGTAYPNIGLSHYNFLSPDIIHGKSIEGNRFQTIVKQKVISSTIAKEGGADKNQTVEFITLHPTDDWENNINFADILESRDIDVSSPANLKSYTVGANNFYLRGTKGYRHLHLSGGVINFDDCITSTDEFQHRWAQGNWDSLYTTNRPGGVLPDTSFNCFTGRILNLTNTQYGNLENAEYIPLGYSLNNSTEITVGGDTYTQMYAFDVAEGVHDDLDYDEPAGTFGHIMIRGIIYTFIQSQENYSYKHYEADEVPYYPKYKVLYSQTEPLGLGNIDITKGYSTGYNRQYSAVNDFRRFVPKPLIFKEVESFTNRSIFSAQAFEGEISDSYRIFLPNNFHDVPKNKGEITDTFVLNDNFFHQTERSLFRSYFNPNTTQVTSQGEAILGNAGIFRLPSKEVFTLDEGYVGTTNTHNTNTPYGRIILDNHQGKVFLFNGGEAPVEISDLGMFSYFRSFINPNDNYAVVYDYKNKRAIINNSALEEAISYYPKTNTWTSRHTFSPTLYISKDKFTYAYSNKDNNIYSLENSNSLRKNSNILLVVNNDPDVFKRFQTLHINSLSGGVDGVGSPGGITSNNYTFNKVTFDKIHCWNEVQNSTELPIVVINNYLEAIEYNNNAILASYNKGNFKLELPLNAVINSEENIFEDSNLDRELLFKDPLTSKFLYLKLSYNNTLPLVLSYIKTNSEVADY